MEFIVILVLFALFFLSSFLRAKQKREEKPIQPRIDKVKPVRRTLKPEKAEPEKVVEAPPSQSKVKEIFSNVKSKKDLIIISEIFNRREF